MSTTRTIIGAALLLAVITTPTIAGKILGTSRQTVYPQNFSTSLVSTVSVYGDWIETIGSATSTSPGVFVTIVDKFNGAQHTSQPFAGRGEVTLKITTNGATPGVKTIRLSGGIFGEASFTITVPESPTVTNVAVPAPADPFKEIIVTLTGTGLQNAIDPADGKIVKDNLVNYITVGGDVLVSSVRVLSSSEHTLQFKVFLSGFVQDVTVDLSFRTAGNVNVPLLNGLKQRIRMKSANVRNYVRSITFPNGSTFDKNSIATVRLNLLFPAPSDGVGTVTIGGRSITTGLSVGNTNRKVYLKLVPGNAFVAVQNGTPINANGITTVLANPGDDVITLTFKVADCLGGMPGTVNTVKLQTWMHTTNTNLPPNFIEQSFGVRCTQ